MTDLTAAARILVADTIVRFDWDDFGLDEVGESEPGYADALAAKIVEALTVLPGYGVATVNLQRSDVDLRIQATQILAGQDYSMVANAARLAGDLDTLVAAWTTTGEVNG